MVTICKTLRSELFLLTMRADKPRKNRMTTEQIDLASVKQLIDHVWELKKQTQSLSQQLSSIEKERNSLAIQVNNQEKQYSSELETLKTTQVTAVNKLNDEHQATVLNLTETHDKTVSDLNSTHAQEMQALSDNYEQQLRETIESLTQKNTLLNENLQQLQYENQSMINRIRGIE